MRCCWANVPTAGLTRSKLPGAPEVERYRPLFGDCTVPSEFARSPARQPTAAITVPPGMVVFTPPGFEISTSVTTLASRHSGRSLFGPAPAMPAHGPVGRFAFAYVLPPSSERKRPNDVAA